MSVEDLSVVVAENRLLILDREYARLLARQQRFQLASKPIPVELIAQIRAKCRALTKAGGSC